MSGEAPAASDGDKITVQIKCSNDTKYPISIARSATILELKQALVEPADCPVERQRLIYSGRVLKNEETVQSYKIGDGHIVHMVKGAATTGANRANAASTTNSNPTSTTATSTTSTTGSTGSTGGMAGDPMEAFRNAMMGAMGGAPGTTNTMPGGMNPFMSGNFGAGMPPVDPATSARMLQNPAFMRMFAEMMSQPEFQEMMTSMNPMMNTPEARAAMQSPEFRQMMSNPELLSQLMGMMPSMMPGLAMGQDVNTNIFGQSTDDGNTTNTNTVSNVPPEERYAEQLRQLNEMGFWDAEQNLRVLVAAGGNVNRAVEMILGGNV